MSFALEKTAAILEAAQAKKGMSWFLEIVVFVLVLLACTAAEVIIMVPAMMVILISDPELSSQIYSYRETADGFTFDLDMSPVMTSDAMTICMLFATAAMIGVVLLFCRAFQKRRMRTLGFVRKGMGKEYLKGLGIGFAMFSVAVLICVHTGSLRLEGFPETFALGIFALFAVGFLIQGMAEEVACRGYFLVSFARRHSVWAAVLANSVVFAALHLLNSGLSALALVNLTLFGVFASVYFVRTGNIWGVGALHSAWNLVQGNVFGIQVSGAELSCSVLSSTPVDGMGLINGGTFGLEGGLAVTVVLAASTLLALRMRPRATAPAELGAAGAAAGSEAAGEAAAEPEAAGGAAGAPGVGGAAGAAAGAPGAPSAR